MSTAIVMNMDKCMNKKTIRKRGKHTFTRTAANTGIDLNRTALRICLNLTSIQLKNILLFTMAFFSTHGQFTNYYTRVFK